jgi:tetratricopeptide (TPR) repeat protein
MGLVQVNIQMVCVLDEPPKSINEEKERKMKKILILALTMLFLVACATTEETPPPKPTDTPIPPTPTSTPTPTPIPPTPTPTQISMEDFIEELDAVVIYQLLEDERNEYLLGYYRFAIGIATELIDTWLGDYPTIYQLRAESYWTLGDFDNAVKDMKEALQRVPSKSDDDWAGVNNDLCWYLAIAGKPEEALPYCEEAVFIEPIAMYLDSRGLVYAMLGRTDEAIADFEKVIEEFEGNTDLPIVEIRETREKWLADLMAGIDFTTPEFLEELQADEVDPNAFPEPDRLQAEDYTRARFSQVLQNDGFFNAGVEVNANDVEIETHVLVFNDCTNAIFLVGPEEEIWGAQMFLYGCTEDQVIAESLWFLQLLLYEDSHADYDGIEIGRGYAWIMKDVKDVYNGEITETDVKVISGIEFTASAIENPELGSGITIIAFLP